MVTKPLNSRVLDDVPEGASAAPAPLPPINLSPARETPVSRTRPLWRVTFHLTGSQPNSIGLDVWRVTVLGRADPMSAFRPDLDYGPYGGMRYGVSRRHALLRPEEDALNIFDQASTNGTWVNGQRLMPGQSFPLSDGDIIELGALRMTLRVDESPLGKHNSQHSKGRMRGFSFRFLGRPQSE